MKIAIIGGGAAGMTAGIYLSDFISASTSIRRTSVNNEVIIFERNQSLGKKILATGNGRCNYFNNDQSISHYNSNNSEYLESIINLENTKEVINLFNRIGIVAKIKNNNYYPFSNQASSIRDALLLELKIRNVEIKTNRLVKSIKKKNNKFIVTSSIVNEDNKSNEILEFDKVIITTGSKASFKTDSDVNGYSIAKSFNHTIIEPLPALVQLVIDDTNKRPSYLKKWSGIRTDVKVSLYENDKLIKQEEGEIQLTDYGVSGICIFNLSRFVSRGINENKKMSLNINFLPFLDCFKSSDYITWFNKHNNLVQQRKIKELLSGILNEKLVSVILNTSNIKEDVTWDKLTGQEKEILVNKLTNFSVVITKTKSFDNAQTVTGGIPLTEIDIRTMESKKVKGLYFAGEILDVDGECGGYNLTFAWISGYLAAMALNNGDKND